MGESEVKAKPKKAVKAKAKRRPKKYRCNPGDLVVIDWLDSSVDSDWGSLKFPMGPVLCQTVGWLTLKRGNTLETCSLRVVGKDSNVGLRSCIPKACIKKVTVIQKGS